MVSIIVPVYNSEKYLCECVDSVLAQTYHDWELIIVDDGSTDSSGTIADNYAASDQRIKVLHVANGGLSSARNFGIDKSSNHYICFLDSDDTLHPEAITIMLDYIGDSDMLIATMSRGHMPYFKKVKTIRTATYTPYKAIESSLYQDGNIINSAWGKLYKRELFNDTRFTKGILYEDLDFFYRVCLECSKISAIDTPLYFYRDTPGSITNKWTDKRLDVLDVVDRIEAYITANHPALLPAARDRKLSANFNMFLLASANNRPGAARRCWQVIRQYRRQSFFNPKVRFKNKAGILLSMFGSKFFYMICGRKS